MIDVLHQDGFELTSVEDQHPVETLSTDGADEALGEGVGPRGSDRRADDLDPLRPVGAENLIRPLNRMNGLKLWSGSTRSWR
jgi:hypothetical protein